jgi:hypothetical protein
VIVADHQQHPPLIAGETWLGFPVEEFARPTGEGSYEYTERVRATIRDAALGVRPGDAVWVSEVGFARERTVTPLYCVFAILRLSETATANVNVIVPGATFPNDSMLNRIVFEFLRECIRALDVGPCGYDTSTRTSIPELVRGSAGRVLDQNISRSFFGFGSADLFHGLSTLSDEPYEGGSTRGRLVLFPAQGRPEGGGRVDELPDDIDMLVRFRHAVPLRSTRKARKILELGSDAHPVVGVGRSLVGVLGSSLADHEPFEVRFRRRSVWEVWCDGALLFTVARGTPMLPRRDSRASDRTWLCSQMPGVSDAVTGALFNAIDDLLARANGGVFVVSSGAVEEANRLSDQSVPVRPVDATHELLVQFAAVDGAVLLDQGGTIHAFGVILDGLVLGLNDSGRGSRFNSTVNYVRTQSERGRRVVAVVVSEDGMVAWLPRDYPQPRSSPFAPVLDASPEDED